MSDRSMASALAVAIFALLCGAPDAARAQAPPNDAAAPKIGAQDIGGVVTSPHGPEAGVWVIAETTELPTKFADRRHRRKGRYLIPDLPLADYSVWVRGYGLVDSPKVQGDARQRLLDLDSGAGADAAEAAHYYPAIYWYSMLKLPDADSSTARATIPAKDDADRLSHHHQKSRLRRLPPARHAGDAHHSGGLRQSRSPSRPGSGASSRARRCRRWSTRSARRRRGAALFRRLDRPHRQRRAAVDEAAAAARHRAQCRHHRMGLGQPQDLSARR